MTRPSVLVLLGLLFFSHAPGVGGETKPRHTNRLAGEKSLYLLQHANNPVDWYPWGEAAFKKARDENKPIFLSIGYSTCHWCHVMEEESFSDPDVALLMNEAFVSIKVDREERPDIDHIYMTVSQLLTGGGGWPLNVLMTPHGEPFFAATYIPKEERFGRAGLMTLIPRVSAAWRDQRSEIVASAAQITAILQSVAGGSPGSELGADAFEAGYKQLESRFDQNFGGFGVAPKFPSPHQFLFLLRYWKRTGEPKALEMVEHTLQRMRAGGIFDHLGLGFHRYSTDRTWLLPHFEKMLYDQAMLAMAYTEAFQATGKVLYRRTAEEIFEYVLREMTSRQGGFYSAEDADSEGEEGKFYLWTAAEVRQLLGDDAELFIKAYGVRPDGNFKDPAGEETRGNNVLHLARTPSDLAVEMTLPVKQVQKRLESSRQKLYRAREKRIHPLKDDKILVDWNGLMIAALAKGTQAFGEDKYAAAAQRSADFVLTRMRDKKGRLLHRYRSGDAAIDAHLDDYAFLIWGLLELYEARFDVKNLEAAFELTRQVIDRFWDPVQGGFFLTADDAEALLARPKEGTDGAIPSGNSAMMANLLRLGRMTGNAELETKASKVGRAFSGIAAGRPAGFTHMLSAVDFALGPSLEVVIVGEIASERTKAMLHELQSRFVPRKVVLLRPSKEKAPRIVKLAPFTKFQESIDGQPTAYVCTNYQCKLPTTDVKVMLEQLGVLR